MRYVLFDLLYHAGQCLLREPLARRREVLAEMCHKLDVAEVRFSAGVIGVGTWREVSACFWPMRGRRSERVNPILAAVRHMGGIYFLDGVSRTVNLADGQQDGQDLLRFLSCSIGDSRTLLSSGSEFRVESRPGAVV